MVSRFFAGEACKGGTLKHIDTNRVEETADEIRRTFRRHNIGNYLPVWAIEQMLDEATDKWCIKDPKIDFDFINITPAVNVISWGSARRANGNKAATQDLRSLPYWRSKRSRSWASARCS